MRRTQPVLALSLSLLVLVRAAIPARGASPAAEAAILQIRVLEGDGAVNPAGARSPRPITVQVTDETGRPVEGASVSFRLPDEGPGGTFASGMRSEVAVTGADGKASVWGIVWNRAPGPLQVRITAVKGQARAGVIVPQHVSDAAVAKAAGGERQAGGVPSGGRSKLWYAVLVVTAGAAAGGAAVGLSRYSKQKPASGAVQPAAVTEPPLRVSAPTIVIGRP